MEVVSRQNRTNCSSALRSKNVPTSCRRHSNYHHKEVSLLIDDGYLSLNGDDHNTKLRVVQHQDHRACDGEIITPLGIVEKTGSYVIL